jgi:hypothetical protein
LINMKIFNDSDGLSKTLLDIKLAADLYGIDGEDNHQQQEEDTIQIFPAHDVLSERLRKSCYYGKLPPTDRPSLALTQLAVEQFSRVGLHKLSRLDVARAAEMSREACASPTALVFALIYLDRLRRNNPDFLHNISSADLFLVSMMVASKFLYDDGEEDEVFNDEWAKSGQMDVKEFNRLEVEFLAAINWNVNVPITDFDSALQRIEKEIAYREFSRRDWATYSDLVVLSSSEVVIGLWKCLSETAVRVTTVCMAAYAASLFTLLGSTALLNQTPFGPNGVAASYRTLMNRRDSTELSTRGPDLILSPSTPSEFDVDSASPSNLSEILASNGGKLVSRADLTVTPAELLTASLLVASIKSSDEHYAGSAWKNLDTGSEGGGVVWSNHNHTQDEEDDHTVPGWLMDIASFIHHATDSHSTATESLDSSDEDKRTTTGGIFDKIFSQMSSEPATTPPARDMNSSAGSWVDQPAQQRTDQRVPDLHSAPDSQWILPDYEVDEYTKLENQLRTLALEWSNSVWKNLKTGPSPPLQPQGHEEPAQCPLRNLIKGANYHPSLLDGMAISVL